MGHMEEERRIAILDSSIRGSRLQDQVGRSVEPCPRQVSWGGAPFQLGELPCALI